MEESFHIQGTEVVCLNQLLQFLDKVNPGRVQLGKLVGLGLGRGAELLCRSARLLLEQLGQLLEVDLRQIYPVDEGAASIPWLPVAGRVYHRSGLQIWWKSNQPKIWHAIGLSTSQNLRRLELMQTLVAGSSEW